MAEEADSSTSLVSHDVMPLRGSHAETILESEHPTLCEIIDAALISIQGKLHDLDDDDEEAIAQAIHRRVTEALDIRECAKHDMPHVIRSLVKARRRRALSLMRIC